jgi:hypothetical protein
MARFEAANYDEALIMWKRAFVLVPHDAAQQSIRAALVANIVAAHRRAYEIGRNPEHLAEGMRVIDLRAAEIAQFDNQDEDAVSETVSLDTQRAELVRLHDIALREGELPSELANGTAFRIEPPPAPALTRDQVDAAVAADPEFGLNFRRGKGMAIGGIAVLLIGSGLLTNTIVVAAAFDPKDGSERDMIPIVVPLGAVAVSAVIVGGTLLGVGNKRKKQARKGHQDRQSLTRMVVPISLPRGGGLGSVGRF